MKKKKRIKSFVVIVLCIFVLGAGTLFGVNSYVKSSASDRIITSEEAAKLTDVDCILVLGCQVKDDGTPSDMLKDRLTRGIEVYNLGAAPKLLMSGDHGREDYDEVGTMKQYAIDAGIASEDIFMDHAGVPYVPSVVYCRKARRGSLWCRFRLPYIRRSVYERVPRSAGKMQGFRYVHLQTRPDISW